MSHAVLTCHKSQFFNCSYNTRKIRFKDQLPTNLAKTVYIEPKPSHSSMSITSSPGYLCSQGICHRRGLWFINILTTLTGFEARAPASPQVKPEMGIHGVSHQAWENQMLLGRGRRPAAPDTWPAALWVVRRCTHFLILSFPLAGKYYQFACLSSLQGCCFNLHPYLQNIRWISNAWDAAPENPQTIYQESFCLLDAQQITASSSDRCLILMVP